MQKRWIVEDTDRLDDLSELHQAIIESGAELILQKTTWDGEIYKLCQSLENKPGPVLAYGTINFINWLRKSKCKQFPLYYADRYKYDLTRYLHVLRQEYVNHDYRIYPLRDLVNRNNPLSSSDDAGAIDYAPVFVRPVSGYKTFSGYTIAYKDWRAEMNNLISATMSYEDPLVLVAPARQISHEYRFVVADNKVVSGSQYMPDEEVIPDDHPSYAYAQKIASQLAGGDMFWQPEPAYTLDVGTVGGVYNVVELNSFSCAGLYKCDKRKVVAALNKVMERDYTEEMGLR